MKIQKITAWLLRIPYHLPLVEKPQHALATFVEIETDGGVKGHSLVAYPMKYCIREFINRECADVLTGMDPLRTEEIRNLLFLATAHKHYSGAWACAASLIDIALWDIKGKVLNQPIWKLLGGARRECPAYVTFGFARYSTEELIELAKTLIAQGHKALKMTVLDGADVNGERGQADDASVSKSAARVRALREAIGPEIELMIDGNKGATVTQALRLAKLCEPYNLTWFEDPVLQGDPRLMARLRSQTTVPIASGSTATSDLINLREYLLHEAVDYLQPNVRDIGGYTQALKAAGLAQAFNVPLAMGGNYPYINMHLHGGVQNGGRVEFHYMGWRCYEAVFDGTPAPANGKLALPETPGLGYTPKAGMLDLAVD